MNRSIRFGAVVVAAACSACGGSTFLEAGDGGESDSGSSDSATSDASSQDGGGGGDSGTNDSGPLGPLCPVNQPPIGSACASEGADCEYGDAWWSVSCDAVVECADNTWQPAHPSYEPCSSPPGPNDPACPSSVAAASAAGTCNDTGLSCNYADGFCKCAPPEGGPIQLDGGASYWQCVPETGCPYPRPLLGTACTDEGAACTYEECSYGQICQDGAWRSSPEGCAGASQ